VGSKISMLFESLITISLQSKNMSFSFKKNHQETCRRRCSNFRLSLYVIEPHEARLFKTPQIYISRRLMRASELRTDFLLFISVWILKIRPSKQQMSKARMKKSITSPISPVQKKSTSPIWGQGRVEPSAG